MKIQSLLVTAVVLSALHLPISTATGQMRSAESTNGSQPFACINKRLTPAGKCPDFNLWLDQDYRWFQTMFYGRNGQALDQAWDRFCKGDTADRLPDGSWRLSHMGDAIAAVMNNHPAWNDHQAMIQEWKASNPDSIAALYVEAVFWHSYAWAARGGSYAPGVEKEAWPLYAERLGRSIDAFTKMGERRRECPAPYSLLMGDLIEIGAPATVVDGVYEEGRKLFPEYQQILLAKVRGLSPIWGGDARTVDEFAVRVSEATKDFEGYGSYVRIYEYFEAASRSSDQSNAVRGDWKKMKRGYEALMVRYPTSLRWVMQYAAAACRANDAEVYRRLRSELAGFEGYSEAQPSIDVCDRRFTRGS